MYSERCYEKMYNGARWRPALERGHSQPPGGPAWRIDLAIWDVKAQALGVPIYIALGVVRDSVRGYASGGWAPADQAGDEMAGYAANGFDAVKMRVVGRDGFSIKKAVCRIEAARRAIGPDVELMIDAHGSLDVATTIKLAGRGHGDQVGRSPERVRYCLVRRAHLAGRPSRARLCPTVDVDADRQRGARVFPL